jgi:bifunctional non-homologous end joining protein LigD
MSWVKPMKPIIGSLPQGEGWAHELKWDGMRLCVSVTDSKLVLHTGSGRDVTDNFPEFTAFAQHLGTDAVFDAEAVVFDHDQPSFSRLQNRIHVRQPSQALVDAHPGVLVVFDLLNLGDDDVTGLGYLQRRQLLTDLLGDGPCWRVPPHVVGNGAPLVELASERDLEGVVSKRINSTYRPGVRSHDWVKVKQRKSQEFVVGGWVAGSGGLDGQIGAVLLGVYAERNNPAAPLIFAGRCGSGLTEAYRQTLSEGFIPRPDSPFADMAKQDKSPIFVEPTMVVEVGFSQWQTGYQLRHPTFRGIRVDREPHDVVDETHRVPPNLR